MLKVSVKIPDASLKAIKAAVERKVAEVVAKTATIAYEHLVTRKEPYWSGEYLSSFNVSFGTPSYIQKISAGVDKERGQGKGADIRYGRLSKASILPNYSNPYAACYITNPANHAMTVEYTGTPTHSGGWYIMTGARNRALDYTRWF